MIVNFIRLTISSGYKYQLNGKLYGLDIGNSNDIFFRMSLGVNFYFGVAPKEAKPMKNLPTVINSIRINSQ